MRRNRGRTGPPDKAQKLDEISDDSSRSGSPSQASNTISNGLETQQRPLNGALNAAAKLKGSYGSNTSETANEEDYDILEVDPYTVVAGAHGGGLKPEPPGEDSKGEANIQRLKQLDGGEEKRRKNGVLRPSDIPTKLPKRDEKNKYVIIADDAELKEIAKLDVEIKKRVSTPRHKRSFNDLVFTRQFTAFDRQNLKSAQSPFHGFFTLFWLGTALFMIKIAAKNYAEHGNVLATNEIMKMMTQRDLIVLGLSDGVMCGVTGFGWILQQMIVRGYIDWNREGWIIQNVWEISFLLSVLFWTQYRHWPWSHTVFFVLHSFVMLMKQHSYAFYNGHLSALYKSRNSLQKTLKSLDDKVPTQGPSPTSPAARSLSIDYLHSKPTEVDINQRRRDSLHSEVGTSELNKVTSAIQSGNPLDLEQIHTFERMIKWEIDALSQDLKGKASTPDRSYPNNLKLRNHYEFIVLPTLVYELEYPRTDSIDWLYVLEKAAATVGILFIMQLVAQTFIYPVVMQTVEMKNAGLSLSQRLEHFPWILSDLLFPFMIEYMMTWYVLFESLLNLIAELTYFADRGFYGDWWNSISWDQFARDWNKPVHVFLLRHVYHSSISFMRVSRHVATLITFFLSALVHELVMWCLFKKLRGYLLLLQMTQIPLVQLSRTRFLKGHATLGNLLFWGGIFMGPSLLCSLYLII